jgi:peptidoglycan/LPS O-acetylase OafA/YrhL
LQANKIRIDLQVIRALAVSAVVLYHFFPDWIRTGLLGVDVFFVLSGYLITGILWRDLADQQGFRALWKKLVRFWARRARRLIPAALLVLVVTATLGYLLAPRSWWLDVDAGWIFAVAYVANWYFANEAAEYLRADAPVSPYQHYWSLSVEEQFYIVLPILLMLMLLVVIRKRLSASIWLLGILSVGSLAYAFYMQGTDPAFGFYSSLTRIWEFGAGGLLALLQAQGKKIAVSKKLFSPVWLGLFIVMIIPHDPNLLVYHNLVAVSLTILAILVSVDRFTQKRFLPAKFLGDNSYSIYLWHWPILVLSPWVLGYSVLSGNTFVQLATLALILVVSYLSKKLIEDPIRFGPFSKIKSGWQVIVTLLVSIAIILAGYLAHESVMAEAKADVITYNFTPSLIDLANDKSISEGAENIIRKDEAGFKVKEFGDRQSAIKIALVGDSHARQFFEPLNELANEYGFGLDLISKSACSVQNPGDYRLAGFGGGLNCENWNEDLANYLAETKYSLLINSNSTLVHDGASAPARSFADAVSGWVAGGQKVLLIRDNAKPNVADAVSDFRFCIENFGDRADTECSTPIGRALTPKDSLFDLGSQLPGVESLDLTPTLCPDLISCPVIIDNRIVYRDGSHLSLTFIKTLKPIFEQKLRELGVF